MWPFHCRADKKRLHVKCQLVLIIVPPLSLSLWPPNLSNGANLLLLKKKASLGWIDGHSIVQLKQSPNPGASLGLASCVATQAHVRSF